MVNMRNGTHQVRASTPKTSIENRRVMPIVAP